jgi:hypothetical protein
MGSFSTTRGMNSRGRAEIEEMMLCLKFMIIVLFPAQCRSWFRLHNTHQQGVPLNPVASKSTDAFLFIQCSWAPITRIASYR